jgi:geranylgeranyl pyrophosphate synthase
MSATALAAVREAPGLERYLELLEERLEATVGAYPGRLGGISAETLAAGGKRLRPLLVFLATPRDERDSERAVAGGTAVELVHMATLVHDDLLDGADLRRGRPTVWAEHGEGAAKAAGDYLFARAFAQLAHTGDHDSVAVLAEAALALARGEALQRRQAFRPETSVDDYLARCSLKTGKLFEAACLLGAGLNRDDARELAEFGLALGIAFQIADDILDCTGETIDTGKIAGTDLREGTPTLPLLLAAREDPVVHRALAGGSLDGALVRVAATGALDRSRTVALEYAERARVCLNGEVHSDELEAMTYAVVERRT